MTRNRSDNHDAAAAEARRWPHSIRFLEGEWERIEAFADALGLTGPEFVRFATLAAIEDGSGSVARLAPLIKMTFRGTHILATRLRQEMLDADGEDELKEMVTMAREAQDELLDEASD